MRPQNQLVSLISLVCLLVIGLDLSYVFAQSSADQIVYAVQTTSGGSDLYLMNADGRGAQQLTHDGTSSSPAWSPGHRQIAYRSKPNDVADIYVMNANGSGAQQITKDNGTDNDYPSWSPDSQQIAFVSNASGKSDVWTVSASGGKARQLTSNSTAKSQSPAWSPDGQHIAYSTNHAIYLMNADGGNPQRLTNEQGDSDLPAWSPDGQQIAYVSTQSGEAGIHLIKSSGNASADDLLDIKGFIGALSWSPDGKEIAFSVIDSKKVHTIRVTDVADPTKTRPLTDASVQADSVSWAAPKSVVAIAANSSNSSTTNNTSESTSIPVQTMIHCPGAPLPILITGHSAHITPGTPNKLRSQPSLKASQIDLIPGDASVDVIEGPVCADNYAWWRVTYNGTTGWTADGHSGEYWILPD